MSDDLETLRPRIIELTETEAAFLSQQATYQRGTQQRPLRCPDCHHLTVLHNGHCCSFCTLPGCKCEQDPY